MLPRVISFFMTGKCNQRCAYCNFLESRRGPNKAPDVTPDLVERTLDTFPTVKSVRLGGSGEPLMNKYIGHVAMHVGNRVDRMALITNGTLIPDRGHDIPWESFQEINISLSDITPEGYKKVTGTDLFDRLVTGIEYARKRTDIVLSIVVTTANVNKISEMVRFAVEYRARALVLQPLVAPTQGKVGISLKQKENFMESIVAAHNPYAVAMLEAQAALVDDMDLKGMKVRFPPVIDFNQLKVGCAMANIYMGVDGNGDVSLCCRGFGPRPEMGNIADGARVYDSGPMKLLRQYVYSENQPLKCSVCYANWTGKH